MFRKFIVLLLVIAMALSGLPVYADIITTGNVPKADQGSGFDPDDNEFQTVLTLNAGLSSGELNDTTYNSLANALTKAKNTATAKPVLLLISPGEYSSAANIVKPTDLVIRGTGDNPEDVIIKGTTVTNVVQIGSTAENNYIMENLTLKLSNASPAQSQAVSFQGAGLKTNMIFRDMVIDAMAITSPTTSINGIYMFNAKNITVENLKVKTPNPDITRAVVLASTSDSVVKGISGNCTIPVNVLDYYDAMTPAADFPDNNYVENASFIVAIARMGRCSYMLASTYKEAYEFALLLKTDSNNTIRAIIDVKNNRLVVDERISSLQVMMSDYLNGVQNKLNVQAIERERLTTDNWYDTKEIGIINPSGNFEEDFDYDIDIDGLIFTAYDENYSAKSSVSISNAKFEGEAATLKNFDFSILGDLTIQELIDAGIIPAGSTIPIESTSGDSSGNIIWAYMAFDAQGGVMDVASKKMVCGIYKGSDLALPQPKKTGYTFAGWYTKPDGTGSNQILLGTGGTTVYAKWNQVKTETIKINNKFTLTLNANKGKVKTKKTYKKTVTSGSKYGSLPGAARKGYNFKGWYTKKSGGKKITSKTVMTTGKNQILYARWAKNGKMKASVSLHKKPSNGSKVIAEPVKDQKICILKITKTGWYKIKAGSKTGYIYKRYIKKIS